MTAYCSSLEMGKAITAEYAMETQLEKRFRILDAYLLEDQVPYSPNSR